MEVLLMEKKKQFKIVKIIDQSTFMINGGANDHIEENDEFKIIGDKKLPIKDPDTGEIIEEIPTYKTVIFAKSVYDKVTICNTEWIPASDLDLTDIYSTALKKMIHPFTPGHYEEANINEEQVSDLENYDETPISLGDKVELVSANTNQN